MSLSMITTHLAEGSQNIRSPGVRADLNRLDSYLSVLEDNRKAARFVPDDAAMALDMANFVCGRLQGRHDRAFVPVSRSSLTLVQTDTVETVQ